MCLCLHVNASYNDIFTLISRYRWLYWESVAIDGDPSPSPSHFHHHSAEYHCQEIVLTSPSSSFGPSTAKTFFFFTFAYCGIVGSVLCPHWGISAHFLLCLSPNKKTGSGGKFSQQGHGQQ